MNYYNAVMCGGKWKGILNPEGFPPPRAAMMPVCTPPLTIGGEPVMRVDVWNEEEELRFTGSGEIWWKRARTGQRMREERLCVIAFVHTAKANF